MNNPALSQVKYNIQTQAISIPLCLEVPNTKSKADHVSQHCSIGSDTNSKTLDISPLITVEQSSSKQQATITNSQNVENDQPMKEQELEIFKAPRLNRNKPTGQIPSPVRISLDQNTRQTNSEERAQDQDQHMNEHIYQIKLKI